MSWSLSERAETSASPDLVPAHGGPRASWAWHRVIPGLALGHRGHRRDIWGVGRSMVGRGRGTSLAMRAWPLAEICAQRGLTRRPWGSGFEAEG